MIIDKDRMTDHQEQKAYEANTDDSQVIPLELVGIQKQI